MEDLNPEDLRIGDLYVNIKDSLWLNMLEATGQPISLTNETPAGGNT